MFVFFQINIGDKFLLRPNYPVRERFADLGALLTTVLQFILGVGAFLMFLFLIIGGLRYIFSGGDPKAIEGARGQITVAIAGFLVILLSFVIIRIVEFITHLQIV